MKKIILFSLVLFFTSTGVISCQTDTIPGVSMEELVKKLQADTTLYILDVRTSPELTGPLGQIDGVTNIPVQELADRLDEITVVKDSTIYVVCRSGNRSRRGVEILLKNGYKAVNVAGGMKAYVKLKENEEEK